MQQSDLIKELRLSIAAKEQALARMTQSISRLRSQVDELKRILREARNEPTKIALIAHQKKNIDVLQDRVRILRVCLDQTRKKNREQIEKLKSQNSTLKEKLHEARADAAGRVTAITNLDAYKHNTPETMDEFFSAIENESAYYLFADALAAVLGERGIKLHTKSILDIGCGPGFVLSRLTQSSSPSRIVGVDFSNVALKHASALLPFGEFMIHDIYSPLDQTFDIVLCTEVLEHLEDPESGLRTVLGSVGAGGRAIITVPDGRLDQSGFHINFWSPESWRLFIERRSTGFTADFGRFQYNPDQPRAFSNIAVLSKSN
ncbi:MAG: methyltransferase domain-containing protein [Parvularcula sp.]|nr:methyltransferase domain-containing protein [Parvularcula sp.]